METFDRNQSPHLPENGAGSWIQCWDAEDCSLTELNMEASSELNSLVEDKEIAAKAVALVVNSTRKGIVALCADVATLLRAKYKLEQKLHRLCPEDSILHGAGSGSIPRSTSESSALCYEERKKTHTKQRRSASNIPRLSTGCHDDRDDHYDDDDSHHATADMMHGCVPEAKRTTQADFTKPHRQKCTHPHRVSREVQCTLDVKSESELQLQDSLKRNAELVKELGSARKEIEQLGAKLRKLQMEHLAMRYHMYDDKAVVENQQSSAGPQHDVQSDCPVIITPPLTDCKCDDCLYLTEQSRQSFQVTLKTVGVKIGDRVLLSGLRMGQVMYLGHIDGAKDKHSLFIGLQLDAPVGCHDGILEGKRYFSCEKNCGMFVPFHKVIRIIKQEEELPPVTDEVTISTQSSCLQSELSHNESCRRLQQGRRNKGSSKAWTKFSKVLASSASDIV